MNKFKSSIFNYSKKLDCHQYVDSSYLVVRLNNMLKDLDYKLDNNSCNNRYFSMLKNNFNKKDINSNRYSSFFNSLVGLDYKIPNLGNYVPQSFILYKGYIILSAYFKLDGIHKNSCLFIIDSNQNIVKRVELSGCSAHLGGICYDDVNNLLWICDKRAHISSYDFSKVVDFSSYFVLKKINSFSIGDVYPSTTRASYMTYFNRKIYVGTFDSSIFGHGVVKVFDVLNDGKISFSNVHYFYVSYRAQGISFINKDGRNYMAISSSYGRSNDSMIELFLYDSKCNSYASCGDKKNKKRLVGKSVMPSMLEGINLVVVGGKLLLLSLYESFATYYASSNNMPRSRIDYICVNDLLSLL